MTTKSIIPVKGQKQRIKQLWECSILIYGEPKIGKSTLASLFPDPLFLSTEDGQGFLSLDHEPVYCFDEIDRVETGPNEYRERFKKGVIPAWEKISNLAHTLGVENHDYKTLVFDTVDNGYTSCVAWRNVHHGEEYECDGILSYGKGTSLIARDFSKVINQMCHLPMGVIFISHAHEKEFTQNGKRKTRVVTTLPNRAMQIVNSAVDMIFYITFKGDVRVVKTKTGPNWTSGCRLILPENLPLSYDAIVEAYTNATDGGKNAKETLIQRIHKGEAALAEAKVDGFEVEKRVHNSRAKHAGNPDLTECNLSGLEAYLQHLQVKYEKGQENGNSTKSK